MKWIYFRIKWRKKKKKKEKVSYSSGRLRLLIIVKVYKQGHNGIQLVTYVTGHKAGRQSNRELK